MKINVGSILYIDEHIPHAIWLYFTHLSGKTSKHMSTRLDMKNEIKPQGTDFHFESTLIAVIHQYSV